MSKKFYELGANDSVALEADVGEKYSKPESGIPKSDLAEDVKTSLTKADTALQSLPTVEKGNLSSGVQASLDKADTALQDLPTIQKSNLSTDVQTSLGKADSSMQHSEFSSLSEIADLQPDEVGLTQICSLMNTIKNLLKPATVCIALMATFCSLNAADFQTAKYSSLVGKDLIVTNLTFDGLATTTYVDEKVEGAKPGDYQNVSNKAYSALQPSDIVNNVTSDATDKPLSAKMGKELEDQIQNLKQRGRYLSLWNCTNGLAETQATVSPYAYKAGDYFIVGIVGTNVNYRPSGLEYTNGVPSTVVETQSVLVNDTYYFDGNVWSLIQAAQKEISFGSLAGSPYDNTNLSTALNSKTSSQQVSDISDNRITNHVNSGYLCTVAAARGMTNALPAWTKSATKPTYTAGEVGARPDDWMPNASDVGAIPDDGSVIIEAPQFNIDSMRNIRGGRDPEEGAKEIVFVVPGPSSEHQELSSTLRPDDSDILTKNLGDDYYLGKTAQAADSAKLGGNTYVQTTNSAVATANAYADGKFLPKTSGNRSISWNENNRLDVDAPINVLTGQGIGFEPGVLIKSDSLENYGGLFLSDWSYLWSGSDPDTGSLPVYLANGTWNTKTGNDKFAKIGDLPAAQIQSDWTQTNTSAKDYIKNKPALATVATSGSYTDLSNKPTIPAAQVNSDWNAASGVAQILNKPTSMKNPNALTFSGSASGSYDGSSAVTVTIPEGMSAATATNIAEAVVSPTSNVVFNTETYFAINDGDIELHSESNLVWQGVYELTNYSNAASISLYHGQLASQRLTSQNALNITLKYPTGAQKAGDAMLRVVSTLAATATVVSVEGATSFHFAGAKDWNIFDAGSTNLLSFTKVAMENGEWEIWVGKAKSEL